MAAGAIQMAHQFYFISSSRQLKKVKVVNFIKSLWNLSSFTRWKVNAEDKVKGNGAINKWNLVFSIVDAGCKP